MTPPFFSIITVTWNAEAAVGATAASLAAQSCDDYEWIVVDGASRDATVEIARQWVVPGRDRLLSEPDSGVYSAMNKGLHLARGQVVQFLNAGDSFADEGVLGRVREAFDDAVDAVYGDTLLHLADGRIVCRQAGPMGARIRRGMPFSHQSLFVRRALHRDHPFDERYRISADFGVIAALYSSGARFRYLPEPLNCNTVEPEALSIRGRRRSAHEDYHVLRRVLGCSRFEAGRVWLTKQARITAVNLLQRLPPGLLPPGIRRRVY